jgi:hypothetical protein
MMCVCARIILKFSLCNVVFQYNFFFKPRSLKNIKHCEKFPSVFGWYLIFMNVLPRMENNKDIMPTDSLRVSLAKYAYL